MIKNSKVFPGLKVSDDGKVYGIRGNVRKPSISKKGYHNITLYVSGGRLNKRCRSISVHRLVWDAFNGPIPEGLVIRHIDSNPSNNKLSNLAIGTHKDNSDDRKKSGSYYRGDRHVNAKLTNSQANKIRYLRKTGVKVKVLAAQFSVSVATIESVIYLKSYVGC